MSVGNGLNRILAESALDGFKSQNFSLVFGKSPSDDVQKTEKRCKTLKKEKIPI